MKATWVAKIFDNNVWFQDMNPTTIILVKIKVCLRLFQTVAQTLLHCIPAVSNNCYCIRRNVTVKHIDDFSLILKCSFCIWSIASIKRLVKIKILWFFQVAVDLVDPHGYEDTISRSYSEPPIIFTKLHPKTSYSLKVTDGKNQIPHIQKFFIMPLTFFIVISRNIS